MSERRMQMGRLARYVVVGLLVIAAMPTFAGAGEAIKDVFVRNTASDPVPVQGIGTQQVSGNVQVSNLPQTQQVMGTVEVSNLPAVQRLRQGYGFISSVPRSNVVLPDDLVLTDLVLTYLGGSNAQSCEAALYERRGTETLGMQFFYPDTEVRTQQLHLESGLTLAADEWGLAVNNDCVLRVLWSGYALP